MKSSLRFFLLVLILALVVTGCGKESPDPVEQEPVAPPDDGSVTVELVDPVCVVINNHKAARPQSGMQQAHLVYEFLVEGGITRFIAVFDQPLTENYTIGPVRSLRPYFAETAMEHGAAVAFSGTSGRTDEMIAHLDLQKITNGKYFWRDDSRKAPHNLYTNLEKVYAARGASMAKSVKVMPQELPAGEEALEFEVRYNRNNAASYKYDSVKKQYMRFEDGAAHVDRETGLQYGATRVIVRTNVHVNVAGTSLVDIDVSGSGPAVLYEGGQKYDLTWEKSGQQTVYKLADGTEVDLTLGNTWIQVVR
ncbi:MAG TPA: DUF3048 domain-containing protein [Oscillospiraceae bacterium]|nr:DUF3048 domain-containing protein [Oscillospiraceae bacterium]